MRKSAIRDNQAVCSISVQNKGKYQTLRQGSFRKTDCGYSKYQKGSRRLGPVSPESSVKKWQKQGPKTVHQGLTRTFWHNTDADLMAENIWAKLTDKKSKRMVKADQKLKNLKTRLNKRLWSNNEMVEAQKQINLTYYKPGSCLKFEPECKEQKVAPKKSKKRLSDQVLGLIPHRVSPSKIYDTRFRRRMQAQANKLGFRDKSETALGQSKPRGNQAILSRYSFGKNARRKACKQLGISKFDLIDVQGDPRESLERNQGRGSSLEACKSKLERVKCPVNCRQRPIQPERLLDSRQLQNHTTGLKSSVDCFQTKENVYWPSQKRSVVKKPNIATQLKAKQCSQDRKLVQTSSMRSRQISNKRASFGDSLQQNSDKSSQKLTVNKTRQQFKSQSRNKISPDHNHESMRQTRSQQRQSQQKIPISPFEPLTSTFFNPYLSDSRQRQRQRQFGIQSSGISSYMSSLIQENLIEFSLLLSCVCREKFLDLVLASRAGNYIASQRLRFSLHLLTLSCRMAPHGYVTFIVRVFVYVHVLLRGLLSEVCRHIGREQTLA